MKVRDTDLLQLVVEQLVHYITTYGYERLGIYNKDTVFIPDEELKLPKLKDGITLTVIKGYTKQELKDKLLGLLSQGIALAEDTVKDVVDIALFVEVNEKEIEQIRNKETRVALYDYLDKIPEDPVEFLRFVVYKATDKTLLIINKETIELIKSKQNIDVLRYFQKYRQKHGLERLAEIFLRFKPLFLAFKTNTRMRTIVNKTRKLAVTYHKPMQSDYLNDVTAKLARGEEINEKELQTNLNRVNTFRKIRLAYALNFRTKDVDSILYKVRNGKGYATDFTFNNKEDAEKTLSVVIDSVVRDVGENVKGKKIFIPKNIVYALPATEKQFTGDFPSGTYVVIPRDMIFGVHWGGNIEDNRIDLDLSVITLEGQKVGWDVNYRTEERDILFSGDMTDAQPPDGASELFYVAKQNSNVLLMLVNYFNYEDKIEVPFKILVAEDRPQDFKRNYTVNPNKVVCVAKSKINCRQKVLGIIIVSPKESRFYFSETSIGNSITSHESNYVGQTRKYLFNFYTNTISLNEVLKLAGAELVTEKEEGVIDLSPETLEKDKIINLLRRD